MGIFEIIIIVAAAIIFIILIRRFPDTSEHLDVSSRHKFNFPKFSFASLSNFGRVLLAKLQKRPRSDFWSEDAFESNNDNFDKNQFEPGRDPKDLEHYSPAVKQLLSLAGEHYDGGRLREAEDLYLKAAAEDPKCVLAYNRLGQIYLKRPEALDDAEEAFRQAYKFDPENGFILDNLGLVNFAKGLFNEAINFYEKSIEANKQIAERHAHLGLAYLSLRHYAKAVRHLARAWALEPSNDEYKSLLDDAKDRERRLRSSR
mgnify:CR=1 FL=1